MNQFLILCRKWWLLCLLILLCFSFYFFHLGEYISFESIKTSQAIIKSWTDTHYFAAVGLFILIFTLLIAATIPGATFLTLVSGFLFGPIGVLYSIAGTTLGGLVLFYAVRLSIGAHIALKSKGWLKVFEAGFNKNAFQYILMLRLFPIFPCWISNIASGALNVPVKTFVIATIIGVTPASVIYVMAGRGLGKILASNQTFSLSSLLTPSLLIPLVALAILSIIPVFYKGLKKFYVP